MGVIAWIVLGLIAGFIASKIVNHTGSGVLIDIVLGVVGAWWRVPVQHVRRGRRHRVQHLFDAVAIVGAVVVLWLYHALSVDARCSCGRAATSPRPAASRRRR